jgi:hypothetical protein
MDSKRRIKHKKDMLFHNIINFTSYLPIRYYMVVLKMYFYLVFFIIKMDICIESCDLNF